MNRINTLRDLLRHFDWANGRVMEVSSKLDDEQLDRPFEIGLGSLRGTLWHVFVAMDLWLQRARGQPKPVRFEPAERAPLSELRDRVARARAHYDNLLNPLSDADYDRELRYADMQGNPRTNRLGDVVMQVYNHSVHHFAQALNMLRHLGAMPGKPLRLDYLFMYYENRDWPAPALSADVLRDYFGYSDWARERVMDVAQTLDDADLDRPFEMGTGSIRTNMIHTHDAESWWLGNWTSTVRGPFPKSDPHMPLAQLRENWQRTARGRDEFLNGTRDQDLAKPIEIPVGSDRTMGFPLGVSMTQLCFHGTHHRAQTINMLRRCGQAVGPTDFIIWRRENSGHTRPLS